jgi:hypothetical protein
MSATAFGPIRPCPTCGQVSSENYDGNGCCWTCFCKVHPGAAIEPEREVRLPEWSQFRKAVQQAMKRTGGHWNYIDRDRCTGRCPICSDVLVVDFIGHTPTARFTCRGGCRKAAITEALKKAVHHGAR